MERAALGFRMHSGWGVLVIVDDARQIILRQLITVIRKDMPGGKQPYHHAEKLGLAAAEKYLAEYVTECNRLALDAITEVVCQLQNGYQIAGAAILQASERRLPPLPQILAAHPLIHTAEGQLFRQVIRGACESLQLPVLGIPERQLKERVTEDFAGAAAGVLQAIAGAGKTIGPPWTADHKAAALAACLAIGSHRVFRAKACRE
ncbi:MAG TPA: hypothetical protein VM912_02240 [Terriglobales bacterium]|nr:hypothetical protein [Terriglobales bacterium]